MASLMWASYAAPCLKNREMAFPRAAYDIDHVFEDGGSIPPTGRQVSAPFVTVLEVSGGLITSPRPYWDLAGFTAQLTG